MHVTWRNLPTGSSGGNGFRSEYSRSGERVLENSTVKVTFVSCFVHSNNYLSTNDVLSHFKV